MKLKLNANFLRDLDLAVYAALEESYVERIVDNTPTDTTVTQQRWFFVPEKPFHYKLFNDNGMVVLFLEKGTGIYGPKKKPIRPKNKKVLRWYNRSTGSWQFATEVKGIKPRGFVDAVLKDPSTQQLFKARLRHHLQKAKQRAKR